MQILVVIGTAGSSPLLGEILPLFYCSVLSGPVRAQVKPLNRLSRFMAFGIRMMGDVIREKYVPKNGLE